jgi:hypothetical protein
MMIIVFVLICIAMILNGDFDTWVDHPEDE